MGSRLDIAKSQMEQAQAAGQTQSVNRIPRKPVPASAVGQAATPLPTIGNVHTETAVNLDGAVQENEKGGILEKKPSVSPLSIPPVPLPQPKRLQPRFVRPNLPLHSKFPLVRAKKLQKVRLELFVFSSIVISAMLAFIVATVILYTYIPKWSTAQVTVACYTVFLWNFAIPALIA